MESTFDPENAVWTPVKFREDGFRVGEDGVVAPAFDTVREYVDAAIRDGLDSSAVRADLERIGFDVDAYDPLSHKLDGDGAVPPDRARALRLAHADRLERDVERAAVSPRRLTHPALT